MRTLERPTIESATEAWTEVAPRYKVLMHDDDETTMDFVVSLLRQVFAKTTTDAERIMLEVHYGGVALVEVVPWEEAELHVDQAHSLARTEGYPLSLSIELDY